MSRYLFSGDERCCNQSWFLCLSQCPLSWQNKWEGPEDPMQYLRAVVSRALAIQVNTLLCWSTGPGMCLTCSRCPVCGSARMPRKSRVVQDAPGLINRSHIFLPWECRLQWLIWSYEAVHYYSTSEFRLPPQSIQSNSESLAAAKQHFKGPKWSWKLSVRMCSSSSWTQILNDNIIWYVLRCVYELIWLEITENNGNIRCRLFATSIIKYIYNIMFYLIIIYLYTCIYF